MSRHRFRVEMQRLPAWTSHPEDAVSLSFEWPQEGAASMKEARVVYFGDDPYVQVLWLESAED